MTLEFSACSQLCSVEQFELMSELMAEGWLKATTKWQALHELPLSIETESSASAAKQVATGAKVSILSANAPSVPSPMAID